jgi:hypothetical protein
MIGVRFTFGLLVFSPQNQNFIHGELPSTSSTFLLNLSGTITPNKGAGWTWCTIQGVFMLCFVCVMTMII